VKTKINRVFALVCVLPAITLIQGCGSSSAPPPPTITAVSVSPQNPTIASSAHQQFTAIVTGAGDFSQTVTWYVNDVLGGNETVGLISSTGNYQAPYLTSPTPVTVTVKAVSLDPTKSGSTQATVVEALVSSVTIDPQSANVYAGSQQSFIANVFGTGNINPNVTWTVNGIPGGNSTVGTIGVGPGPFYTAPDVIPNPPTVTLTASSFQDPTKSGTASVTIVPPPLGIISVSVNPTYVNMPAGQTQTFIPTVIGVGNFNPAVTWSVGPAGIILSDYGSISAGGVYTPPNNLTQPTPVNITATSVADPSKTAIVSAQVFPTAVLTDITPNPAQPGDTVSINGTNLYSVIGAKFTGPNNMILPIPTYGPGVTVPFSAVSGPVSLVTQFPGFAPVETNTVQFTRTAAIRIRAASRDVSAGETTKFSYIVFGTTNPQTIQWTVDVGSIDSSGTYQAPSTITSDTFATVQGCITGTQLCQSEILGLHPFTISPYPAVVPAGNSLQMESLIAGTQQSPTWSLFGEGSLTPSGLFTAGKSIAETGGIPISATLGGATENATIGVTGQVPGVVGEVSDYVDYSLPLPLGTYNEWTAVAGNRLYALASGTLADYYGRTFFWIDVYDISNPAHPVWLSASETAFRAPMYVYGKYLYQLGTSNAGDVIAIFDVSGTKPVLLSEGLIPLLYNTTYFGGIFWGTTGYSDDHNQVTISEFDLRSGGIVEHDFQFAIPNGIGPDSAVGATPLGTDTNLYVFSTVTDVSQNVNSELDTYDLTMSPANLLQRQPLTPPQGAGTLWGSFIVAGDEIFDVSSGLPVYLSLLPSNVGAVVGYNGKQLLTMTYQNGGRVVDVSDLTQPKFTALLFDRISGFETAVFAGPYVVTADIDLRVFDAAPTGGGIDKPAPLPYYFDDITYDQLIYQSRLFVATETDSNAYVSILDLTANPITELGRFDTGAANPISVQATGSTMYAGTDQAILVTDISNPANPTQIGSVGSAVNALAISGTYLYAGTQDGHLVTYNIAQPGSPAQVSRLTLPVAAVVMRTSNNLLFIADDASGLLIYSLTTPSSPVALSQFQAGAAVGDLAVDGTTVLLATADQGLVVLDITNPGKPVQVGEAIVPVYGFTSASAFLDGITLDNKIAYVGTWEDGGNIYGYDYSTASHPRLVSVMPEGGVICEYVLTLQNDGIDLFDGGYLDGTPTNVIDLTQPMNVINSYPIFAKSITNLRGSPCDEASGSARVPGGKRPYSRRRALRMQARKRRAAVR